MILMQYCDTFQTMTSLKSSIIVAFEHLETLKNSCCCTLYKHGSSQMSPKSAASNTSSNRTYNLLC